MTSWVPLMTGPTGTQYYFRANGDGTYDVWSTQEVDPILDRNKAMYTHNDGYSPSRELRRAASIPMNLIQKWRNEEGINVLHPDYADALKRKLNDIDYLYLRTAPGRI